MRAAQQADERAAYQRRARAEEFLLAEVGGPKATLDGWVKAGVGDADIDPRGSGQVCDGAESLDVLVVQRDRDGRLLTPDWIGPGAGQQIPLEQEVPGELARTIAACTLRLPLAMSQMNPVGDAVIAPTGGQSLHQLRSDTAAGRPAGPRARHSPRRQAAARPRRVPPGLRPAARPPTPTAPVIDAARTIPAALVDQSVKQQRDHEEPPIALRVDRRGGNAVAGDGHLLVRLATRLTAPARIPVPNT
jgi:hypothetical protein